MDWKPASSQHVAECGAVTVKERADLSITKQSVVIWQKAEKWQKTWG